VPAPGGGYLLNGRKAFISNGHVAGWHIVVTCEDRRRVPDTAMVLAVPRGAAGLSLGAHEHKMGQRACVASELVFENCHVPAAQVAHDRAGSARLGRPHAEIMQTALDYVVSSTRAGVGAFATGVAAGAYRAAAGYAHTQRTPDGTRLAELQWVQTLLADLAGNAMLARMSYLESSYANTMAGMYALLAESPLRPLERWAPGRPLAALVAPILRLPLTTRLLKRHFLGRYPKQRQRLTSGLGSLAKITCSDLAVANAHLAIDLLGADGLRHEHGVEKRLRDAKLLQIYEGTNQINRVNLFKCLLRENDDVPVFVREDDPTPQPPSRDSPAAGVDAASPPGEPVDPATAPVPAPESAAVPAGAG
jgi:alkylation response protein AidB-like acyl-CoA dehydrogenase